MFPVKSEMREITFSRFWNTLYAEFDVLNQSSDVRGRSNWAINDLNSVLSTNDVTT